MDLRKATYNELSFLAFGEAQALKKAIDEEFKKLDDIIFEQGIELAELKGEPNPYEGT